MVKSATTFEAALRDWASLNKFLKTASETDAAEALKAELVGKARLQFIDRLFGRFNILRGRRERLNVTRQARQ